MSLSDEDRAVIKEAYEQAYGNPAHWPEHVWDDYRQELLEREESPR